MYLHVWKAVNTDGEFIESLFVIDKNLKLSYKNTNLDVFTLGLSINKSISNHYNYNKATCLNINSVIKEIR